MPDWQTILTEQLAAYDHAGDPTGRWAQLATVGLDGAPAVRTVVLRGRHDGALVFTSDTRAAKMRQIAHEPRVEVAFNFTRTRSQLRVAGKMVAVVVDCPDAGLDRLRGEVWGGLSDEVRSGFVGGPPGRPVDLAASPGAAPHADGPPPSTFALLVLWPERVDQVELEPTPHRRTLHARDAAGRWHARAVHP